MEPEGGVDAAGVRVRPGAAAARAVERGRVSEPGGGLLGPLARFHVHHVVPRLGAWLSGEREYRYLQESVAAFPPAPEFAELMASVGLEVERVSPQTLGTAHLYVTRKPTSPKVDS